MDAKLIIANELKNSSNQAVKDVFSPWEGQHLGTIPLATAEDAKSAIDSAVNAWSSWKETTIYTRIKLLHQAVTNIETAREEIALNLCLEIGKTIADARSEVDRALEYINLTADAAKSLRGSVYYGDVFEKYPKDKKTGFYTRKPLGVVLAISPFNYPINLSITKIAPALVTGNCVVLKSATIGSLSSYLFYKCFIDAGLPAGVFNFLCGNASEIGDVLLTDPRINLIAFTGSTEIGNHIKDVALGVPLLLELGGKDTALILEKADLETAANEIVSGAFSYSGQRCTAQKMVVVIKELQKGLEEAVLTKAKSLGLSPLINAQAADYIESLKQDALDNGAKILLEGTRSGNKMSPTIMTEVTDKMRLYKEEQFGPILPIVVVSDTKSAINIINNSSYGLQASIYTQDIDLAFKVANQLEVGTVQINGKSDRGPDNFPFGGVRDSGQMMQGLHESFDLMTRGKLVVLNLKD